MVNLVHETTYKRKGIDGKLHRNRLKNLLGIFERFDLPAVGTHGDFGCSNGYIIENLQREVYAGRDWTFEGYDHKDNLLELAREKQLPDATFHLLSLNDPNEHIQPIHDVVTCLETLEHVGDYKTAVKTLLRAMKPGGYLIISVPYEVGLPGFMKYVGRRMLRRNAYEDFFDNRSEPAYFKALLLNQSTDHFRQPPQAGWSPHLGFDNRVFGQYLAETLVRDGGCTRIVHKQTFLGCNEFFAFQKKRTS